MIIKEKTNWKKMYDELYEIRIQDLKDLEKRFADTIKKLKECDWIMQTQIDDIDSIIGSFNHSHPEEGNVGVSCTASGSDICECGHKQEYHTWFKGVRQGNCKVCDKCKKFKPKDNNIKGLKVIDGTPTAISNYLSEREKDNNIKGCGEFIKSLNAWHSDTVRGHKVYFADAVLEGLKELKSKEKKRRIESPDYPESKEEWEECEDEINKLTKEEYLKSEEKGR